MGQRVVRFSDLTNKIIEDDAVARIVIEQHPALENGPVEIEVAQDEIKHLLGTSLDVVSFKVFMGEGSAPETVTMEIAAFNKLADGGDMADVIRRAQPAYPPRRQTRPSASIRRQARLRVSGACRQAAPGEDHGRGEGDRPQQPRQDQRTAGA
jgi:hypothetical protein